MATKKTPPPPAVEVLDPIVEEQALVTEEASKLTAFLSGLGPFFTRATELVDQGKRAVALARALKMPTNADEDLHVQAILRKAKASRKVNDETWQPTSLISQLHKKLVAGRERSGKMFDEAAEIAQRLHNDYVRAAEQKARDEQDRLRLEAEADARLVRAAELEKLEAEALAAEAAREDLSEREQSFVLLMSAGAEPLHAARTVGYKDPALGNRLMTLTKILDAIEAAKQAKAIRAQAEAKKAAPIIADVPDVKADVAHAAGSFDRSTWTAIVDDEEAFMAALLDPRQRLALGIPTEIATFSQAKLNEQARGLQKLIDRWPGVRSHEKKTTV